MQTELKQDLKKFGNVLSKHWHEIDMEIVHEWEKIENKYGLTELAD